MMNTNNTNKRPALSRELKSISYKAYKAIETYESQIASGVNAPLSDLMPALSPCLHAFDVPGYDNESTALLILQRLVSFGTKDGRKGWKILGVTTFRNVMRDWSDAEKGIGNREVVASNAGKEPAEPKAKTEKPKKPTKAQLEAQNADLLKRLAELEAKVNAAA